MFYKVFMWICMVQICQVAADNSKVLSTGAIIGLIGAVLFFIAAIVIAVLVILKMRWRHLKRKQKKKVKIRIIRQSPSSSKITDSVERLPDIPEEDESIRQSSISVRDESNVIFQPIRPDVNKIEQNDVTCSVTRDNGDEEEKPDTVSNITTEGNKEFETDGVKKSAQNEDNGKESEEDFVKNIQVNDGEEHTENNKSSDILITRVVINESVMRKDVPHLNSTENIFSEYDAAMSYKAESTGMSKSEGSLDVKFINGSRKQIKPKTYEFTQDDSDLNLQTESKVEAEKQVFSRNNKSEGNIIDALKSKTLSRKSSLMSKITSKSFEWNFDYISPYSMSEKQKQESLERKVRMQKRRRQLIKQKREENDKRRQENMLAFEKWKQQKNNKTHRSSERVDSHSIGSEKLNTYTYWYP